MADKVCYGQPYILKDQLIQDTVTFSEGGQVYNGTNVVIEDIWEDLMADSHQYKKSGKKYFYWEVSITNDEDELITIISQDINPEEAANVGQEAAKTAVVESTETSKEPSTEEHE